MSGYLIGALFGLAYATAAYSLVTSVAPQRDRILGALLRRRK